jgi:hypothetical protein
MNRAMHDPRGLSHAHVDLSVSFPVGRLTPRGVRQQFIQSLRIAIARSRLSRAIEPEIAEELWRALPKSGTA